MEVREIEPADFARVGELTVAAYKRLEGHPLTAEYEAALRDVALRADLATVLVAVDDGAVVGAVTYVSEADSPYSEHDDPEAASIRMLAVDPEVQGRGIGGVLTQACIDRATAEGRRYLVLHSATWMEAAHRIYLRAGFVRDPSLDWAPIETISLWGFRLELPSASPSGSEPTAATETIEPGSTARD